MEDKLILTAGPSITATEISYVLDAVENGWNQNWSGYLKRFEAAFARYVGTQFALATSSCTGALHLSLLALDIGPGDEVLVPEITWVATASAVRYCGAAPIAVDVEPDTWCLDVGSARRAVTRRTKAIVPVHLYGHPTDMRAVVELAQQHGLKILEDAAPGLGATIDGRQVGSWGDAACFSFQGAKIMTTGEGGMLVTNDQAVYERAHFLGDHGRDPNGSFMIEEVGYKYKMSNLQAALGLAQLERIEELVARKRLIYQWYHSRLDGTPGLTLNAERPGTRNIYWMTSVVLDPALGVARDEVIRQLKARRIDSRPFFPAFSSFPMFDNRAALNPVAHRVAAGGINLPSGHNLSEADVDRVSQVLIEVVDSLQGKSHTQLTMPNLAGARQIAAGETISGLQEDPDGTKLTIAVAGRRQGELVAVGWRDAEDSEAVERLATWRATGSEGFPTQFKVTEAGTQRWLVRNLLEVPDRLLFWVNDAAGRPIGHLGLFRFDHQRRVVEVDNVVRGVSGAAPGLMEAGLRTLIDWAFSQFELEALQLRVFADNRRAVRLYERCGFAEASRVPMISIHATEGLAWIEPPAEQNRDAERFFATMRLERSAWQLVRERAA